MAHHPVLSTTEKAVGPEAVQRQLVGASAVACQACGLNLTAVAHKATPHLGWQEQGAREGSNKEQDTEFPDKPFLLSDAPFSAGADF